MAKYIITKFALTTGVRVVNGKPCNTDTMIDVGRAGYFHKPDWHTTIEDAVDRVHQMRAAAVKSTQKKLAKLEELNAEEVVRAAFTPKS